MSDAVTTYDVVCHSVDPAAAIRSMSDGKLHGIILYLGGFSAGIPALVLAMAEAEAARRWLASNQDRAGAVGEGCL